MPDEPLKVSLTPLGKFAFFYYPLILLTFVISSIAAISVGIYKQVSSK